MLDQVLEVFRVVPNYDLSVMKEKQTLFDITSNILTKIKTVLEEEGPDVVLVHGKHLNNIRDSISLLLFTHTGRTCGGWTTNL